MTQSAIVTEEAAEKLFEDYLDSVYNGFSINNRSWSASRVLKKLDPATYRKYFNDWRAEMGVIIEGEI